MARKLTYHQVRVLAALERRGRATAPRISTDLGWPHNPPDWSPSKVVAVLESLAERGLVSGDGDPQMIYNDPELYAGLTDRRGNTPPYGTYEWSVLPKRTDA
jgi:hypothetical protein